MLGRFERGNEQSQVAALVRGRIGEDTGGERRLLSSTASSSTTSGAVWRQPPRSSRVRQGPTGAMRCPVRKLRLRDMRAASKPEHDRAVEREAGL